MKKKTIAHKERQKKPRRKMKKEKMREARSEMDSE